MTLKKIKVFLFSTFLLLVFISANDSTSSSPAKKTLKKVEKTLKTKAEIKKLKKATVEKGKEYYAHIKIAGVEKLVKVKFFAKESPYTVSNFINLARNGFYDSIAFHRVIKDFMAQGGDPQGTGVGGPGYKFSDEKNTLKHERGSLSMANSGPNTNGSQFFICYKATPWLNGKHTIFGKVIEGMDIVDKLTNGSKMEKVEIFETAL